MSRARPEEEQPQLPTPAAEPGTTEPQLEPGELPMAKRRRNRFSPIWIVPIMALGLLGYLAYGAITTHGPTITITFKTASGLRVEQTQVMHKAVALGTVRSIELSESADHVVVRVSMRARAAPMLTDRARFWVVRPRLQAGALAAVQTGLETLVSGSYIELDPGGTRGAAHNHFVGLEEPPAVRSGEPGTTIVLRAREIGAIGAGSPILHRRVPVGEVLGYDLEEQSGSVSIRAFVHAPHDRLLVEQTRFWSASGLDLSMGADGLHLEAASLRTVLSGGVAFRTPDAHTGGPPVETGHVFPLFATEAAADIGMHGETVPYVAYFRDSVQGLAEGSPVRMFGLQVGNVTDLQLVPDPRPDADAALAARVGFVLQPARALAGEGAVLLHPEQIRAQVADGLRVVLETNNYLTGEKVLSLSYQPGPPANAPKDEAGALVVPSQTHGIGNAADALGDVAARLQRIPYEQIARNLNRTLQSVERVVSSPELARTLVRTASALDELEALARDARTGLAPVLARLPQIAAHVDEAVANANAALANVAGADSDFQRQAQHMLAELAQMARSVRLLAEFLERHPEALVRGRSQRGEP